MTQRRSKFYFGRGALACAAIVLFVGCVAAARAQQKSSGQVQPKQLSGPLAEAQTALMNGNAQNAIEIVSDYLKAHPDDSAAHTLLGQAYAGTGQFDRAAEEFQAALQTAPDNFVALAALAEIYEHGGAPDKAEPLLARAARASHGVPEIRMEWAMVLAQLHKYKDAESALAGLAPPTNSDERLTFYRLKASVALGLGDASGAAADMEKALALKTGDAGLTLATAVAELQAKHAKRAATLAEPIYAATHDPKAGLLCLEAELDAQQDFQQTLKLLDATQLAAADELEFRQRLAALLISYEEYAASIEELQAVARLDPSRADLQYNLALAEFRAGRLDEAVKSAEECKNLGDDADLEDLIGDIQEARGDNLDAVKSYQAAVALAPNEEKYRLSLAVELIRHSNLDVARTVLKQAEEARPNSWRIELALGMVEYFAGTDEEATRYLLHATELAPSPEEALRYLGDVQIDRASAPDPAAVSKLCEYSDQQPRDGRMQYYCGAAIFRRDYIASDKSHADEILKRLRASEALSPKDAETHCQLGKTYRWLERWPEALTESKTCARLDPDSADAHYRLAQIYQHTGQRELSQNEMKLYESASNKATDENARRQAKMKTFTITMQNESQEQK
jgi:tetratricopeptide (TPR) repeat protein